MEVVSQECSPHIPPCSQKKEDVARPTVEFQPSVWGDFFVHLPPSFDQESKSRMQQRLETLKTEVWQMLRNESDLSAKMCIIDAIQRLGVARHFEEEIKKILNQVSESKLDGKDLYAVALRFRLLRQEGYSISDDEFNMFKDEDGNFMESLSGDVKGLLCLYEAAHLATHGDVILDEAIKFCEDHLKNKLKHAEPDVAIQVAHALEIPLHRRFQRLETRHFISVYERFERRSDQLLELAKLDFNLLLSLHQEEIKNLSIWWKELDLTTKLTFARDKLVETYFWMLGVYSEPSVSRARVMATKVLTFTCLMDDIYDAYGTLEELEVFTDALQRWDTQVPDQLPECLKIYLIAYVNTLNEFEDELAKDGYSYRVNFLRKEINGLAIAYFGEAKWRTKGYIPSFEAHMHVTFITSVYPMLACASFVGLGEIATKDVFNWVSTFPRVIKASSAIGRLMNDIVSYEREERQEDVASSVLCYMKEHCTSLEEACAKIQIIIEDAWKDINQELLSPTIIPEPLLTPIINLARVSVAFYKDNDAYTFSSTTTKDYITLSIIEHISL